jgi:glycosyltransferase involved in cell wall biosynthesis
MTAAAPQVTVVIPAYNAARYIGATLASVLGQSVREIEVIVVDDCSKDNTAEVVREIAATDPRLIYVRTEKNFGGPAGPRNVGVGMARAPFVAFCDSDDLWVANKLERQLALAATTPAPVYCTNIVNFRDGETPSLEPASLVGEEAVERFGLMAILLKNRVATSSAMVRREDVLAVGGFNEARDLAAVEDWDLWLRLLERSSGAVALTTAPLIYYRRLPSSISANKSKMVVKMLRVARLFFERRGQGWMLVPAAPVLILTHVLGALWLRRFKGGM